MGHVQGCLCGVAGAEGDGGLAGRTSEKRPDNAGRLCVHVRCATRNTRPPARLQSRDEMDARFGGRADHRRGVVGDSTPSCRYRAVGRSRV
jgi:hypothetical protein